MIEGTGRAQNDQKPSLQALGIISYDDATGEYRIRAWNDGRFLESPVQLFEDGKSLQWGFGVGDIRSSSLLQIDKAGQWTEKTVRLIGPQPPRKLMDSPPFGAGSLEAPQRYFCVAGRKLVTMSRAGTPLSEGLRIEETP